MTYQRELDGLRALAVAALVSVSNIVFYAEAGYWDADSELKPLLHTWSLGVEEQFYLVWPALLLMLFAWRRRLPLGAALGMLAVGGAVVTIAYTSIDSAAAFFLSPFRVFQFASGAVVPFLLQSAPGRSAGASPLLARGALAGGVALILGSIVRFDAETRYPGWAALLPTLGTALALLGSRAPAAGGPLLLALVLFGGTESCGRLQVAGDRVVAGHPACTRRFERLLTPAVARRFDVVAVSASNRAFSRLAEPFLLTVRQLKARNPQLKIMTFGSYLQTRVPCARLINETGSSAACAQPENLAYFEADPAADRLFEPFMAITDLYIDRIELLCEERRPTACPTETPGGVPAFLDKHHHSLEFSRYTGRRYARRYGDPLQQLFGS